MAKKMYGDFRIQDQKKLQLSDNDNSHVVSLRAPNLTADVDLVLPSSISAGFLKSDGSGNLSFSASVSLTSEVSGVLPLANGGSNKALTASAGSIVYSDADSFELTAVGTSGQLLQSNGASAPSWLSISSIDHGALAGLGDDDHTQYTLADGSRAFSGDQSMGNNKLTNLAAPTASGDAANKAYVDAAINGLDWKASVRAASTANVDIATGLENGDSLDGVTLATGDRVLLKDQSTASQNGIYVVVASGAASRSPDADADAEVTAGLAVWVTEGTTNADSGWVLTTNDPITVDTTALSFAQFTGGASITAGDGLTKTGSTIDFVTADTSLTVNADSVQVNLNAAGGLETSSGLRIKLEASNPSLQISSNELGIKFDPAGALSKGASGTKANVDDSTIEIATNALQLKDGGITNAKVNASAAIAYSKLNLSGSIVNADINASAAIALSKIEVFRQVATWANGDGVSKTVAHSFATDNVLVQVEDENGEEIGVDTVDKQAGQVVLTSSSAPATNWKVYLIHMGS